MSFNCFNVTIDADTQTVTLADALDLDGKRAVIPRDDVLRDLPS